MNSEDHNKEPRPLPRRLDRRPRLDPYVYGPSGYAVHVTIGAYEGESRLTANMLVAGAIVHCLEGAAGSHHGELYAYCLMPDHLHFIVAIQPGGTTITRLVQAFRVSTTMRTKLLQAPPLFQRGFYDTVIRGDALLPDRCNYVVNNPVRRGIVTDWREYPYAWLSPEMGS
jgi:putative transposase